jgi:flagellar export protein FliJ
MTSHGRAPLHMVLAVRNRREEVEEQVLTALLMEIRQAELRMERLRTLHSAALQEIGEFRQTVLTGADLIDRDAQCRRLAIAMDCLTQDLNALELKRQQQNAKYKEARCQREVISELMEQRATFVRNAANRAEQRRSDDTFLCRTARKEDRPGQTFRFIDQLQEHRSELRETWDIGESEC